MNRKTLACLCSGVLTIGLIATMSLADEPEPVNQTTDVSFVSHEFAPALDGAYAGSWVMNIGDATFAVESASAPLAFSGQTDSLGGDSATTSHVYNLQNGNTIQTEDEVYVVPAPLLAWYQMIGTRRISQGTGVFANTSGTFNVNAVLNIGENGVEMVGYEGGPIQVN